MTYSVSRRTVEIGVRMALGARPAQVLRTVAREGFGIVLSGGAIGLATALLATRPLQGLIADGLTARDPLTFIAVVLVLALAGFATSLLPAVRAVHVDPNAALRQE
jgi:putative ABC transport system permease protein